MAIFTIEMNKRRNENLLVVAPDWVLGASKDSAFAGSTASEGTMNSWYYDEFDVRDMISYLCKRIINKYEITIFKDILFRVHCAIGGNSKLHEIFDRDLENFTYVINRFKLNNMLIRKINYYFPPTNTYKEKQRLLYLLIALQHVICEQSDRMDLRIPTVIKT